MIRRGAIALAALRGAWSRSRRALLAHDARPRSCPTRTRASIIAARDPAGRRRRSSARTRWCSEVVASCRRTRTSSTSWPSPASTSSAGTFRNNAATIFVTLKHWDERTVPVPGAGGRVLRPHRGTSRRASLIAFNAAADLRPRHHGRLRVRTCRTAARAAPKRLAEVAQQFIGAPRRSEPSSRSVQTFWRAERAAALRGRRPREGEGLGVPVDEVFNTLAATLGTLLRERLQQVRPHVAGADVRASADFRKRPEDVGSVYVRSAERRDDPGERAREDRVHQRPRARSSASTTCRR